MLLRASNKTVVLGSAFWRIPNHGGRRPLNYRRRQELANVLEAVTNDVSMSLVELFVSEVGAPRVSKPKSRPADRSSGPCGGTANRSEHTRRDKKAPWMSARFS